MHIIRVRFRADSEFEEAFRPEFHNGGLFCPTTTAFDTGTEVIVELSAPSLPNKTMIRGVVRSWQRARPRLRERAGAIIEFARNEEDKCSFILESIRGNGPPARRRRHSRLPIEFPVRFRADASDDFKEATIHEISAGGAALRSQDDLDEGQSIILEIVPPGAVSALEISCVVAYHNDRGESGLKFVVRDAAGSRQLSELIRRLKQR